MGQLESEFQFTGRLGNVTAYRMRWVDKIFVRKKGGSSKERFLKERSFARTRENNAEFSGRARGVSYVRKALAPVRSLADYNFVGHINKVLKYVQFDGDDLITKLRADVEGAVRAGRIDYEESGRLIRFFEDGLHGYTYLEGKG